MTEIPSRYGKISVLYEDNQIIGAVKPCNLPSQGDLSGDEDMLSLLKAYIVRAYHKPGAAYLGLVHRLDRPVGGVMVFARTSKAASRLSAQFAAHTAKKTYLAVLEGEMKQKTRLEGWLTQKQGQNARVVPEGTLGSKRAALTSTPLACRDGLTLVQVELETGRKHQIRVQHADIGLPLWGDNRYGHGRPGQQIALWAWKLELDHPTRNERVMICCPPPIAGAWTKFENEINSLKLQPGEDLPQ
ncbi:MAG: RluA family pseudouridine synthase [Clostridia bacterium]|nr:RluA family pseudouridine synthase [Clostridia bacterium]